MKRFIIILALFSYLFPQDGKLAVSILDFTGEDVSDKLLRACYQKLETSLIESNRFTVIAKNQREQILEEMKFQSSGVCDEECAVEIGKLVGAEYLMLGDIIGFADLYQINIKIVNIEKGDIVEKVTKEIQGNLSDLLNGMAESSREITRRIASGEQQVVTQQPGMAISQKKYGDIIIESNPPGATIFVDDDEKGFTPQELTGIEVGTRRLMLVKPGYETLNKGVIVSEDAPISVSEVLIPKMGSLTVLSEPIGATVFLNDVPKGKTPLDIPSLNIGDYLVTVSLENYQDITQRITVEYNENTTPNIDLKPLPGKINIIVSPSSTDVSVNGKKIKTNSSGITSVELTAGTHRINFSLYGYEPVEKVVTIAANESMSLEVNMKKLPAGVSSNTNMGFLTVHAYNDNVKLKIAGVNDVQSLPLEYYELKYGSYTLKAFKKGFESKMLNADIERQRTTKIEINLNPKQRAKAVRYSMMFPGGGQMYTGSKSRIRGLIYAVTFIGTGTLLNQGISTYSDENKLLDQYQANYNAATSAAEIDATWALYEQQSASVNDAQTNLMILSTTLVSAWLTSIIDSYFFSGL